MNEKCWYVCAVSWPSTVITGSKNTDCHKTAWVKNLPHRVLWELLETPIQFSFISIVPKHNSSLKDCFCDPDLPVVTPLPLQHLRWEPPHERSSPPRCSSFVFPGCSHHMAVSAGPTLMLQNQRWWSLMVLRGGGHPIKDFFLNCR